MGLVVDIVDGLIKQRVPYQFGPFTRQKEESSKSPSVTYKNDTILKSLSSLLDT
jgi:hypothetical protein